MGIGLNLIFGSMLIIVWTFTGILLVNIVMNLSGTKDEDVNRARNYIIGAAALTWVQLFIFSILFLLSLPGVIPLFAEGSSEDRNVEGADGPVTFSKGISLITVIFLAFAIISTIGIIILDVLTQQSIKSSKLYGPTNELQTVYQYCYIVMIINIVLVSLLLLGLILYLYFRRQRTVK